MRKYFEVIRIFLFLVCISIISSTGAAATADVSLVGLWSAGDCSDIEDIEYQGYSLAAYENDGFFVLHEEVSPVEGTPWYFIRESDDDPYAFLVRRDGEKLLQAWPFDIPETNSEIEAMHDQLGSGQVLPDGDGRDAELFDIITFVPCPGLPFPASLVLGEPLSVLQGLDGALQSCIENTQLCPLAIFDVYDVSGDGTLTTAELARAIRATLAISSAMADDVSDGEQSFATIATSGVAPIVASAILHSFDYDGSRSVSFEELLGERLPQDFRRSASDATFEVSDWVNMLSDGARTLARSASTLIPG